MSLKKVYEWVESFKAAQTCVVDVPCRQTAIVTYVEVKYRSSVCFWPAKHLTELANEPAMYEK